MKVTRSDIKQVFADIIEGRISREEADLWACARMKANDWESLEFEPTSDEDFLWSAIDYLCGIDMQTAPGEYMHDLGQIREVFEERWNK